VDNSHLSVCTNLTLSAKLQRSYSTESQDSVLRESKRISSWTSHFPLSIALSRTTQSNETHNGKGIS
jgi:hypothetical protein